MDLGRCIAQSVSLFTDVDTPYFPYRKEIDHSSCRQRADRFYVIQRHEVFASGENDDMLGQRKIALARCSVQKRSSDLSARPIATLMAIERNCVLSAGLLRCCDHKVWSHHCGSEELESGGSHADDCPSCVPSFDTTARQGRDEERLLVS